jgi:AcrR family transcriptional regulator
VSDVQAKRTGIADRREEILEAAVQVFGRQGFRRGSLRDVASAVGLSQQGVLHHFPTKEQLLMATLERYRELRQAVQHDNGLVAAMRVHLEQDVGSPDRLRFFITLAAEATDPEHPAHGYFRDRYRRAFEWARDGLRLDIQDGRTPPTVDAEDAAVRLIALSDGLQLQYLYRPEMDLLGAYDRNTADLVLTAGRQIGGHPPDLAQPPGGPTSG